MIKKKAEKGFTIIELLVVVVVIGFLGTLVATTFTDIQTKRRDDERKSDITLLQAQVEKYFVAKTKYPSLSEFNNPNWRATNTKGLEENTLKDPRWNSTTKCYDTKGTVGMSLDTKSNCYVYQVKAANDGNCNNTSIECTKYSLSATLESGEIYQKQNLN